MRKLKLVRFLILNLVSVVMACSAMIATTNNSSGAQERPKSRKVDEFGFINRGDLQARLDNLAVELQNEPSASTYIKFHSGRRLPPEEIESTANYAKEYLIERRNIDSARITTVDAGPNRNSTVEFWIVPQGATPPI